MAIDEIDLMARDDGAEAAPDELASGLADDVADEEKAGHCRLHGNGHELAAPILEERQHDAQLAAADDGPRPPAVERAGQPDRAREAPVAALGEVIARLSARAGRQVWRRR